MTSLERFCNIEFLVLFIRSARMKPFTFIFEMVSSVVFLLSVFWSFIGVFSTPDIVGLYLNNVDTTVTRVRTVAERDRRSQEFAALDFIGLVEQYGYNAEEHTVLTIDGYLLTLHRVNGSPTSPKAFGKPVIFLAPGLVTSSDFYVMFGPQQSLVLQLADAGYDVWIGNFRGTTYSRRHVQYSTASSSYEFWDFNLDDLALVDLPAFIDTTLEVTYKNKLTYIGYSMGTTTCYMLLSTKPQYNDAVNVVISIAPEVFFTPPFSPLKKLYMQMLPVFMNILYSRNIYDIVPLSKFNLYMGRDICKKGAGKNFCQFLFRIISNQNIDSGTFTTIFDHFPAGTSFNIMTHFYQLMLSGGLTHYNYGPDMNKAIYNSLTPPQCDLSKVTSPQAIIWSGKDAMASEHDVMILKSKLKNVVLFEKMPGNCNHLDYLWDQSARELVFNRVLDVVRYFA